jgi:hypothetical protein
LKRASPRLPSTWPAWTRIQAAQPSKASGHERQQTIRDVGTRISNTGSTVAGDFLHLQRIGVQVYSQNSMPFLFCQVQILLVHHPAPPATLGNGRRNLEVHLLAACCMCVWQAPSHADSQRSSVATRSACPCSHGRAPDCKSVASTLIILKRFSFDSSLYVRKSSWPPPPPARSRARPADRGPPPNVKPRPAGPTRPRAGRGSRACSGAPCFRPHWARRGARDQLRHSLAAPTVRCRFRKRRRAFTCGVAHAHDAAGGSDECGDRQVEVGS